MVERQENGRQTLLAEVLWKSLRHLTSYMQTILWALQALLVDFDPKHVGGWMFTDRQTILRDRKIIRRERRITRKREGGH